MIVLNGLNGSIEPTAGILSTVITTFTTRFSIQELCISPTQYMMIIFPYFMLIACSVRHLCITNFSL